MNVNQYELIAEGMACASPAWKLHLMMAWHLPVNSRPACTDDMTCALQAPELHVMEAWPICHKLRNCMNGGMCLASSRTACNDGMAYAHPIYRTTYDDDMAHVLEATRLRAHRAYNA